jgi:hypothetical protein
VVVWNVLKDMRGIHNIEAVIGESNRSDIRPNCRDRGLNICSYVSSPEDIFKPLGEADLRRKVEHQFVVTIKQVCVALKKYPGQSMSLKRPTYGACVCSIMWRIGQKGPDKASANGAKAMKSQPVKSGW